MCGLAGLISFDPRLGVDAKVLQAMSDSIHHRGPDASGFWRVELATPPFAAALTHRRLAILDLEARANQPMQDAQQRFCIAFNGEIYNFRELRSILERDLPQFQFRTTSDTEVIIAAYQLWGDKCVDRLEGMFAFVLVDLLMRTVFIARDRMGQKPLYLAAAAADGASLPVLDPNVHRPIAAIAFASEISSLRQVPWVDQKINAEALTPYLLWGYIPAPATMYRGIHSLPAGHAMTLSLQQATVWRYFSPHTPKQVFIPGETDVDATRRLVLQAVRRQLIADVPVGCFLSGGMDSSIMAAAMRQACGQDQELLTFTIGFDDSRYDETPYAQAVADHLKTRHQCFHVTLDAAADLNRIVASFSQPFADSSAIPTYHLSELTRQGVKVALSGDGGDELFGGYDRYRAMRLGARLHPAMRAALAMSLWQKLPGSHPKSRLARMKRLVKPLNLPPGRRYARYMELFSPEMLRGLIGPKTGDGDEAYLVEPYESLLAEGRDEVQSALAVDRVTYLPEDLLVKVDRCSMQHALEVRNPFMDTDLVLFASGLDTGQLLGHGSKSLLRYAFAGDLPAGHFDRPKMGFAVPIGQWLRTDLRPMLRDLIGARDSFCGAHFRREYLEGMIRDHEARTADHSQRLYAILVLELWWSMNRTQERDPAAHPRP